MKRALLGSVPVLLFAVACSTRELEPPAGDGLHDGAVNHETSDPPDSASEAGSPSAVDAADAREAGDAVTDGDASVADGDASVTDGDASGDAMPDAADSAAYCTDLRSRWHTFVEQNRSCVTVSDCQVVGGTRSCDCKFAAIGQGSGDAISVSAGAAASLYFNDYAAMNCQNQYGECDSAPARNLRCESGKCTADQWSCLPAWDGGPPDDPASQKPEDNSQPSERDEAVAT